MNKFEEEYRFLAKGRLHKNLILSILISFIAISIFYTSAHADTEYTSETMIQNMSAMIEVTNLSFDNVDESDSDPELFAFEIISKLETSESCSEEIQITEDAVAEDIEYETEETESFDEVNTYFSGYVDIASDNGITAEMLDEASAYFQKYQTFENQFVGNGWIFIEAQEQSGIDALWLYTVAVYESGWGTSSLATEKGNYYGIGAWDTDITKAKTFNNSLYDGIVNGAIWIAENYYQKGYTNMIEMNSDPYHSYAPGNEVWIPTVSDFINKFYYKWRTTL